MYRGDLSVNLMTVYGCCFVWSEDSAAGCLLATQLPSLLKLGHKLRVLLLELGEARVRPDRLLLLSKGCVRGATLSGCRSDWHARITLPILVGRLSIRLIIALVGFRLGLLVFALGLDHAEDFNRQRVVHQVLNEVLRDRLNVLPNVLKVRISLLLSHLCFKHGLI